MNEINYIIDQHVFTLFPGYVRGIVIAEDCHNGDSPAELVTMLRQAEEEVRARLTLEGLTTHPRFAAWREAFRAMGSRPSDFRPSIEGLVRRVLRNDPLPSINALVDIGNVLSLRYLVPAGAHAIDVLTQDIHLRPATGSENFIPLGSDQLEHPNKGEIIFTEGDTVLTRRWVWRQSTHTLTLPESKAVEFNVDGLPPMTPAEVETVNNEIVTLCERFCGAHCRVAILSPQTPSLRLR